MSPHPGPYESALIREAIARRQRLGARSLAQGRPLAGKSMVAATHVADVPKTATTEQPRGKLEAPPLELLEALAWPITLFDLVNPDGEVEPVRVPFQEIIKAASKRTGVPIADLKSSRRDRPIAKARQIAFYLTRRLTALSTIEIGRRFGGRDHSTVIYGINEVERLIETDDKVRAVVADLLAALTAPR